MDVLTATATSDGAGVACTSAAGAPRASDKCGMAGACAAACGLVKGSDAARARGEAITAEASAEAADLPPWRRPSSSSSSDEVNTSTADSMHQCCDGSTCPVAARLTGNCCCCAPSKGAASASPLALRGADGERDRLDSAMPSAGAVARAPKADRADRALNGGELGTAAAGAVASSVSTRRIAAKSIGGSEAARWRGSTGTAAVDTPPVDGSGCGKAAEKPPVAAAACGSPELSSILPMPDTMPAPPPLAGGKPPSPGACPPRPCPWVASPSPPVPSPTSRWQSSHTCARPSPTSSPS